MKSHGGYRSRTSETRSATLKGRPSHRKGQRMATRSSLVVGLPKQPAPDPTLKCWPKECVIIVAATPATVSVRSIRGLITDQFCRDCGQRLAVDSVSIAEMVDDPRRQRRPIEFLGLDCCFRKYSTKGVQMSRAGCRSSESGDADAAE
jgi:hypothetical protein